MKRREFLKRAALGTSTLLMGGCLESVRQSSRKKPNIIFVFADQMRAQVLGCYGGKAVPTPHIDRMARDGVVFDNAISTYPVCSPYRAMLLSGLYPMNNRTVSNDTALRSDVPTVAKVCKMEGYATGYIGKWHLENKRIPFVPKHRRFGFDFWASNNCSHDYYDSFYCGDTPKHISMPGYEPDVQTDIAINYINQNKDRPFCLFMSWGPPHDPYRGPKKHTAMFPADEIEFRENVNERAMVDHLLESDPTKDDAIAKKLRPRKRALIDNDKRLKKEYLQGYYALTASLDDCMGRLQDALKVAGVEDDTILVFSSDHGDMLGSHRMASKQMPFEESICIPGIFKYPRKIRSGTRTDALLGPIDFMPTMLGLAGIDCPEVDGVDLSMAAMGKTCKTRDGILIMKMVPGGNPWKANGVTPWRGVRTERYTYARLNDRGPWVLFDNKKDPYQMNNLIHKPEYAQLQKKLDRQVDEFLKAANDPDDTGKIREFLSEWKKKSSVESALKQKN